LWRFSMGNSPLAFGGLPVTITGVRPLLYGGRALQGHCSAVALQ
jgi:hypothetical protein